MLFERLVLHNGFVGFVRRVRRLQVSGRPTFLGPNARVHVLGRGQVPRVKLIICVVEVFPEPG